MSVCFDIFHPSRIGTISYPSVLSQFRCLALGHNTVTLTSMSLELANLQLSHCGPHRHERLRQTLSIITLILLDSHAQIQEISSGGGGPGQSDKKALTTFFFSPQLNLQKSNGQFQRNLSFFKVPEGVQHFSWGSNFFQGRGGSNCLFPIETNITSDFPGGGGSGPPVPPPPPLDAHLIVYS